jgi:hypothetical protein
MRVTSQSGNAATVAFSSVAHHTDRIDRCTGQATLVGQGSQWLVDHIDVSCATDGAGGQGKKPKKAHKSKRPKH